ncbi:MAG TPA: cytochrome b5 domain-containing protein [Candidatus Paceibacterota bacterium]|nr:cytochrome b5 domain-containing protein [Candidatus Paceibacterota bacterium]
MKTLRVTIGVALISFVGVLVFTLVPAQNNAPIVGSEQNVQAPTSTLPTTPAPAAQPATPKATPPVQKTSTPTPAKPLPAPVPPVVDTRCIITIDGTKYNVTDFRYQHPGGNVFVCGTDMSVAFHNRHNPQTLNRISNLIVP